MAKGMFVGIGGKARKVKKIYVGIGGKARKVKKAYVGIAGKARLFWSGGEVSYYGTVTSLSASRRGPTGGSVGNYALFAGAYAAANTTVVDAYNTSLVRSTATELSKGRGNIGSARVGNYALFAGGVDWDWSEYGAVDAYNTSLTKTTPSSSIGAYAFLAGASVGNYAVFCGAGKINGSSNGYHSGYTPVYAYNANLVLTASSIDAPTSHMAGASVGKYALFAGGSHSKSFSSDIEYRSTVYAFNENLAKSTTTSLYSARSDLAGASAGNNYAVFAGGSNRSGRSATAEAYNTSLARSSLTALNTARDGLAGVSTNRCAIFAGGYNSGALSDVESYNTNLVKEMVTSLRYPLGEALCNVASATVGGYILFTIQSTVQAYSD